MGLDMYLSKRKYVKNWDHMKPEEKHQIKITKNNKPIDKKYIDPAKISYVIQDVGYWRKANAIHKWFIDNCSNGEDSREFYVGADDLEKLLKTVNEVLDNSELIDGKIQNGSTLGKDGEWVAIMEDGKLLKDPALADKLLPTESGFFFGSTDYDEYYYDDLVRTKEIIEEALLDDQADFEYYASW